MKAQACRQQQLFPGIPPAYVGPFMGQHTFQQLRPGRSQCFGQKDQRPKQAIGQRAFHLVCLPQGDRPPEGMALQPLPGRWVFHRQRHGKTPAAPPVNGQPEDPASGSPCRPQQMPGQLPGLLPFLPLLPVPCLAGGASCCSRRTGSGACSRLACQGACHWKGSSSRSSTSIHKAAKAFFGHRYSSKPRKSKTNKIMTLAAKLVCTKFIPSPHSHRCHYAFQFVDLVPGSGFFCPTGQRTAGRQSRRRPCRSVPQSLPAAPALLVFWRGTCSWGSIRWIAPFWMQRLMMVYVVFMFHPTSSFSTSEMCLAVTSPSQP